MKKEWYFLMSYGDPDSETSGGFGDLVGIYGTLSEAEAALEKIEETWFKKEIWRFCNGKLELVKSE